uniref:Reverse transcriptase Ty1/copia-type domain-containing protein n=1 Tax=Cannabis sativa TaxID=3483 RepID=A0A803PPW1_CANSA
MISQPQQLDALLLIKPSNSPTMAPVDKYKPATVGFDTQKPTTTPTDIQKLATFPAVIQKPATASADILTPAMAPDDITHTSAPAHAITKPPKASKFVQWLKAMDTEFFALKKNNTWTVVSLPPGYQPIGNKWVYKIKYNSQGEVKRYKACLVAKGRLHTYDANTSLSKDVGPLVNDATSYRSLIGKLLFLTVTRPDIAYTVNRLVSMLVLLDNFISKLHIVLYNTSKAPLAKDSFSTPTTLHHFQQIDYSNSKLLLMLTGVPALTRDIP